MTVVASAASAAPSPMRGEIQSRTIPCLFRDLGTRRATGVLTVTGATARRTVLFQGGRIVFATSSDRDDRFNQILLKAGVVSIKDLLRALEIALATRDRLGEVMIRLRMLTPADVDKWVKVQVREILFGLFNHTAGQWAFDSRPIGAESISLNVPGEVMVIEGIRRITSWARTYEEVGGLNTEYLVTRQADEIIPSLPLLAGERALIATCGAPTSLGDMCEASEMSDFQVCRSVWALLIAGVLMKA